MSKWEVLRARVALLSSRALHHQWFVAASVALVVGALAALAVIGAQHWAAGASQPSAVDLPRAVRVTTTTAPPPPLVVYVAGAVTAPGLRQFAEGARVADALDAAGGPAAGADVSQLNLAAPLVDGTRVYVPAVGEQPPPEVAAAGPAAPPGSPAVPVDLNRASEAQLEALPGVGPATAAAIVAHRREHGPYRAVDDLLQVRGIGPAKLESLRSQVRV